jgi:carboxypeptidase family protein
MRGSVVRCNGIGWALVGATLLATRIASAQTISGRVVAKSDGAPVPGAIVALLDSSGRAVITKLAEDGGTFTFDALSEGRYAVRVERVGFRSSTTAPFLVRQGETIDLPIRIAGEGLSLRAVVVNADRRCLVRPQEGVATAQLWSEARKALSATQLTQLAQAAAKSRRDPHRFAVRWRNFKRDLEPRTLDVLRNEQYDLEGETVTPFVTANADSLARDGYMAGDLERGGTFYAPDANILLSDRFLDTHCFRLQASERRDDLIGLAFEPVGLTISARPERVDVRGVLWLDRASAELRYMEYTYVNLPLEARTPHVGGQLEFRPLPDGRWIVWRWYIRTPALERRRAILNSQLSDWRTEIVRIREDGAELLEVLPAGTRRSARATLRGNVIDSLSGATTAGVRVFLSGTSLAALTQSDGSYVIESVPPGSYVASIVAPRLDSLLVDPPFRQLTLSAGEDKRIDLAVPSLHTLSAQICASPIADSSSLILGVVRDSSGSRAGVLVRAEWTLVEKVGTDRLRTQPIWSETVTTGGGRYALCDLPQETRLTLRAGRGPTGVVSPQRPVVRGEVRRVDLTLRKP